MVPLCQLQFSCSVSHIGNCKCLFFYFMEHVIYYIMYFFSSWNNLLFSMIIYWSGYLCANYHSHVRSPTVAIAIFFFFGTCNILRSIIMYFFSSGNMQYIISTQSKGVQSCNICSVLSYVCLFVCFFFFFFLVDTSQREYTVTKKIGLNRLLFMSIIVALLATVQTDRFNHYMRHTKIPYRSDLEG